MLIGYARVSIFEQSLDLQTDALKRAGCERLYTDQVGGARAERSGLDQVLLHLRKGDTFVVWKLDRLGRSVRHLIGTVGQLQERKMGSRSLQESIDTTAGGGSLVFHRNAARGPSPSGGGEFATGRPGPCRRRTGGSESVRVAVEGHREGAGVEREIDPAGTDGPGIRPGAARDGEGVSPRLRRLEPAFWGPGEGQGDAPPGVLEDQRTRGMPLGDEPGAGQRARQRARAELAEEGLPLE
jgi:hypothetical protein